MILAAGSAYTAFLADAYYPPGLKVLFWFIVAGAQYSLIKAPVPDSFTPTGEGGTLSSFSRAFYLVVSYMSGLCPSFGGHPDRARQ